MNSLIRPGVSVSLFLILSSPGLAAGDSDLGQRFLRDAPRGWAKLREAERRLVGVAHIEYWSVTKGQKIVHLDHHIEFKRNGDLVRLVKSSPKSESSSVEIVGPRYFFHLTKATGKAPTSAAVCHSASRASISRTKVSFRPRISFEPCNSLGSSGMSPWKSSSPALGS